MKRLLGMVAGLMLVASLRGPADAQCSQTWISSGLRQQRIDASNQDLTQSPWNFVLVTSSPGGAFNTSVTLSAAPPSWPLKIWVSATDTPAAQLLQIASPPASYPRTYPVTVTVPAALSFYKGQPYFYFTVYTSVPLTCTIP